MSLNEWAFDAKHIPGSIYFNTPDEMLAGLRKDDDIVVYCSNPDCLIPAIGVDGARVARAARLGDGSAFTSAAVARAPAATRNRTRGRRQGV
jgi:hypothetical protein